MIDVAEVFRRLAAEYLSAHFDYRGNRELSCRSANEQIKADALVPERRPSAASGSLRGLQPNARLRVGHRFQPHANQYKRSATAA
jgi:hypothetical protein